MGAAPPLAPGAQPATGPAGALARSPAPADNPAGVAAPELGGPAPQLDTAAPEPTVAAAAARARIALLPAGARHRRARLLDALEHAYPVRFEEPACAVSALAEEGFDAVVAIGGRFPPDSLSSGVPLVDLPASLPRLHTLGEEHEGEGEVSGVALAAHPALARPLHGARLTDRWTPPLPADALAALAPGHTVLATLGGAPAWALGTAAAPPTRRTPPADHAANLATVEADGGAPLELLAAAPAELAPGEALRERLAPGRCLALLALVHFLRQVAGRALAGERPHMGEPPRTGEPPHIGGPPPAPPLHAAFVLDDPNLHSTRYGHLRYAELARHAGAHGYHMAIAMPPIDGWFAHPRAVRLFREHPARLSLCIHGNDHLGGELGRVRTPAQGLALARHALARAAAFERRTRIPFERVMVPPHEQLTEPAARGLREAGFVGTCVSRPYPWIVPARPGPAAALSAGPAERGALAGWKPFERVAGGLPVLLRTGFNAPREDLVLRAFLGQPLIVYGHHDTLADGLDALAATAAAIDALGEVRWGSLARIALGAYDAGGRIAYHAGRRTGSPYAVVAPAGAGSPPRKSGCPPESAWSPPPARRPAWRPLLRRLASEARDRARL